MKEADWNDCLFQSTALKISPDLPKVRSLIETSKGRIIFLQENIIKENNANYLFEGYYSSLLEILHALVLLRGYKVENHLCLGYFLRDVLKTERLFSAFDQCRLDRNHLVYYGRKLGIEPAKLNIERSINLIKELELLVKEEMKKI